LFCDNLAVVVAAISAVVVAVTLSPAPQQKSKKIKKEIKNGRGNP